MKYAFWRKPNTKLCKTEDSPHAPVELLKQYGQLSDVKDKTIHWASGFLIREIEFGILSGLAVLEPDRSFLNDEDARSIVKSALNEIVRRQGGGKPVSTAALVQETNEKAREFFRKPSVDRTLVTSLSVEHKCFSKGEIESVGRAVVGASRSDYPFPAMLRGERGYTASHIQNSRYQVVKVATKEISENQAVSKGLHSIKFLVGVWNFISTYCSSSSGFSQEPQRRWVSKVHVGPIQTLYGGNGMLVGDRYWYDPSYTEDISLFRPRKGWEQLEDEQKRIFGLVESSAFQADLVDYFCKYSDAVQQTNLNVGFVMLWALLERITGTIGGSHDETVKRASREYTDFRYAKQLLNQVRCSRNQFVHSASSSGVAEQLCWITKSYVDAHLNRLIRNPQQFSSTSEYADFLALPRDDARLQYMHELYGKAIEMQTLESKEAQQKQYGDNKVN